MLYVLFVFLCFFFFNDTATTEIYTLSLHDALPISGNAPPRPAPNPALPYSAFAGDRKSTRLNSSHANISYAVFCLKKKKNNTNPTFPEEESQTHTSDKYKGSAN